MTQLNQSEATAYRTSLNEIRQTLIREGWILLRGEQYNSDEFNNLMQALCKKLTYDPARRYANSNTQKVEAGTDAIGLHIENGNTPLPPDIVAFHSVCSASHRSQTTLCDGVAVLKNMHQDLFELFSQPITVSRDLPLDLWRKYVATALGIENSSDVTLKDLEFFISSMPGQSAIPKRDGGIHYELSFNPIRTDNFAKTPAFANALLGPSYNYETPVYRFRDGSTVCEETLKTLVNLCEQHTIEIQWQDGDVAIIDNKRFMHGRRAITVPLEKRQLHIGMGLGLKD